MDLQKYIKKRDQLQMSYDRLLIAQDNSMTVYDRTLEEIAPLLSIYENGNSNGYQNIIEIISVTFDTVIRNSPTALVFDMIFKKHMTDSHAHYEESYIYNSMHRETTLERMADDMIYRAFMDGSKRSVWLHTRIGRQAESDPTQEQIFNLRCAHVSNIGHFFNEIQSKLMEVQMNIDEAHEGSTQLSQNLTSQGPQEDEELNAYIDLIRGYEDLSMESLRALESTIFSEWQATMEFLYSESGSVGEVSCDGFADCLQTAVDELQSLINLTPDSETNPELISLLPDYAIATKQLLDLALISNISIDEGLARVGPIIRIANAYATNNYWCNDPPSIIVNLPIEVNVSLGGTLQLLCEAESNLTVTYEWRRNDNVLPQFTTNELIIPTVQRLDSGNYSCLAINPVGSAETIMTTVIVYELPEFYLTPEPVVTYFGDENGAWFACNATSWPYPGWRWLFRSTASEEWTTIEGEDTNELLILNPQQESERMYVCEAFNYHGSIRSESVTLTLLTFTVSQQQFPIEFSMILTNQSCSLDDLYISLYSLISGTIAQETAIIENFNVTQVDEENYDVSLQLKSENVTSIYLNLMTYEEISNLALPQTASLRNSVQLITDLLNKQDVGVSVCPGHNVTVVKGSLVVGKLRYICPPGQQINSDYLLCCK